MLRNNQLISQLVLLQVLTSFFDWFKCDLFVILKVRLIVEWILWVLIRIVIIHWDLVDGRSSWQVWDIACILTKQLIKLKLSLDQSFVSWSSANHSGHFSAHLVVDNIDRIFLQYFHDLNCFWHSWCVVFNFNRCDLACFVQGLVYVVINISCEVLILQTSCQRSWNVNTYLILLSKLKFEFLHSRESTDEHVGG